MDPADVVWNRAAMDSGGPAAREGDRALASVLRLHGLAMNGGLLDAVEQTSQEELVAAEAGYRWLGLAAAADAVAGVCREIEAGGLDDLDRAEDLERRADEQYARVVPSDRALFEAFRAKWVEEPDVFAVDGDTGRS